MNEVRPQHPERRVLAIVAHPDDELLGLGGTLALHVAQGDRVWVVIACLGEDPLSLCEQQAAQAELGIERCLGLGFPDQGLDRLTLTELISPLEEVVRGFAPQLVYAQFGGDINRDHQLLFEAILVATRPTESGIEAVYAFETASSTEWAFPRRFVPDTWVDISTTLDRKLAAMACYASRLRPYPHPRSLEALRHRAQAWGHQCCLEAAEVFMTIRRICHVGKTLL